MQSDVHMLTILTNAVFTIVRVSCLVMSPIKTFCSLLLLVFSIHHMAAENDLPAKKYTIDLDVEASQRWNQVAIDHASAIKKLLSEISQLVPATLMEFLNTQHINVAEFLPYPYGVELAGLAKAAGVSETLILLTNMLYEITAYNHTDSAKACTSIVARTVNGTVIHARNFDYRYSTSLRDLVIEVNFLENGNIAYTGTTFAGLVGLPSAQKPNSYTITINERDSGYEWENLLEGLLTGTHGIAQLVVRDLVANPTYDFKMAVQTLLMTPLITTSYFIIGGINEGVIMTHGRTSAVDTWWLGSNHSWYILETNYDHWKAPPAYDDRRDVAIKGMNDIGFNNISVSTIFKVLSIPPVLNSGTIFTNVMSAGMPWEYKSWVRLPSN